MSADAKLWKDGNWWHGLHDGDCVLSSTPHENGSYYLSILLDDIETCMGGQLRWEFRTYPDGQVGLVGYIT